MSVPADQVGIQSIEDDRDPARYVKDPAGFDIDLQRPLIHNDDGSISTERTTTLGFKDDAGTERFYNIPTIWDGKQLSVDEAAERARQSMKEGWVFPNFGSIPEAEEAARARSQYIGQARGLFDNATVDIENVEDDPDAPPDDKPSWWQSFKTTTAGAAQAGLGIAQSLWDTPRAAERVLSSAENWVKEQGVPDALNPYSFPRMVADWAGNGFDVGSFHVTGTGAGADSIQQAMDILPEISPTFARLGAKGEEVDAATSALFEGRTDLLKAVAKDPEAWGAFIGQGLPSLYTAWKSGGSIPFISWLEAMGQAQSVEDYERRTGQKVSNGDFANSVLIVGAVNGFLEKFGLDAVLGKALNKTVKNAAGEVVKELPKYGLVGRFVEGLVGEGGTEALQQLTQNVSDLLYDEDARALADAAVNEGDWKPFLDRMSQGVVASAMGGAGLGGAGAVGHHGLNRLADRNREERIKAGDTTKEIEEESNLLQVPVTGDLLERAIDPQQVHDLTAQEQYTLVKQGLGSFWGRQGEEFIVLNKKGQDLRKKLTEHTGEHITMEGDTFSVEPAEVETVTDDVDKGVVFSRRLGAGNRLGRLLGQTEQEREQAQRARATKETERRAEEERAIGNVGVETIERASPNTRRRRNIETILKDRAPTAPEPGRYRVALPEEDVEDIYEGRPIRYAKKAIVEQLDRAANYAATSPKNEKDLPTEEQIAAGNYRKGHIRMQGLDLSVENPKGSTRTGRRTHELVTRPITYKNKRYGVRRIGKRGATWFSTEAQALANLARVEESWDQKMSDHYGYIRGTVGKDKDHIDAFVGENPFSENVYVVNQVNPKDNSFDEHKVMLGYNSQEEAEAAYARNYPEGWKGRGTVSSMTMAEFKDWIENGDHTRPAPSGEAMPLRPRRPRTNAGKGTPIEKIRQGLLPYVRKFYNVPDLHVVEAFEDLPLHLQGLFEQDKDRVTGFYDYGGTDETVYMIANNIDSMEQAVETLMHEYVGHFGLRSIMDENYDEIMDQIYASFPREVEQAAQLQGLDFTKLDQRRVAAEEFVAYLAGKELSNKPIPKKARDLLRRVIERIRLFVQRLFGQQRGNVYTERDILQMIRRAHDYVTHPTAGYARQKKRGSRRHFKNPTFYSQLFNFMADDEAKARTAEDLLRYIGTPQIQQKDPETGKSVVISKGSGALGGGKIKGEEVQWSGLMQWLENKPKWFDVLRQIENIWQTPAASQIPKNIVEAWRDYQEANERAVALLNELARQEDEKGIRAASGEDPELNALKQKADAQSEMSKVLAKHFQDIGGHEEATKIPKDVVLAFLEREGVRLEILPAESRKVVLNRAEIQAWDEAYGPKSEGPNRSTADEEFEEKLEEQLDEEFPDRPEEIRSGNWDDSDTDGDATERDWEAYWEERYDELYDENSSEYEWHLREARTQHGWVDGLDDDQHQEIEDFFSDNPEVDEYTLTLRAATERRPAETRTFNRDDWEWDGRAEEDIEEEARDEYRQQIENDHYTDARQNWENDHTIYRWSVGGRYDVTRNGEEGDYYVYDYEDGNDLGTYHTADSANEAIQDDFNERRGRREQELRDEYEAERQAGIESLREAEEARQLQLAEDRERFGIAEPQDQALLEEHGQRALFNPTTDQPIALPPPPRPKPVYGMEGVPKWQEYSLPGGKNYQEWIFRWNTAPIGTSFTYTTHWPQTDEAKNFIAHVRFDERTDSEGNTIIYIDEFQSDWHSEIKKKGLRVPEQTFINEMNETMAEYKRWIADVAEEMKSWPIDPSIAGGINTTLSPRGYELSRLLRSYMHEGNAAMLQELEVRREFEDRLIGDMMDIQRVQHRRARAEGRELAHRSYDELLTEAKIRVGSMPIEQLLGGTHRIESKTWAQWLNDYINADLNAEPHMSNPASRMNIAILYHGMAEQVYSMYTQGENPRLLVEHADEGFMNRRRDAITFVDRAVSVSNRWGNRAMGQDPAPFSDTWPLMAMKAMIREAVNRGHTKIAVSVGEVHGLRWSGGSLQPGFAWSEYSPDPTLVSNTDLVELLREAKKFEKKVYKLQVNNGGRAHFATLDQMHKYVGMDAAMFVKKQIDSGKAQGMVNAEADLGRPEGLMWPADEKEAAKRLTGSREMYNFIIPSTINKWLKPFKTQMKHGYVNQPGIGHKLRGSDYRAAGRVLKVIETPDPNNPMTRWTIREMTEQEKTDYFSLPDSLSKRWWVVVDENGKPFGESVSDSLANASLWLELKKRDAGVSTDSFEAYIIEITPKLAEAAKQGFPLFMKKYPDKGLNAAIKKAETDIFPKPPSRFKTLQRRVEQIVNIANKQAKIEQALIDQFAGIKWAIRQVHGADLDASESGYKQAHFTTGLDGQMYTLLSHGMFEWKDGITQIKPGSKGLLEILEPVHANIDKWGYWMAAVRANRLMKEGREHLFDQQTIDELLKLGEYHPEFKYVAVAYAKWKGEFLDWAQEAGVIDGLTRPLWEQADHVPFYRVKADELGGNFSRNSQMGTGGLANQYNPIRRLRGGKQPLGDILENIVMNLTHVTSTAMKNRAAALTIENLKDSGLVEPVKGTEFMQTERIDAGDLKRKLKASGVDWRALPTDAFNAMLNMWTIQPPAGDDIVSVLVNGKKKYFHIKDETLFRALTAINQAKFTGPFAKMFMAPFRLSKRFLSNMITLSGGYMVANWLRDGPQQFVNSRFAKAPRFDRSVTGIWKAFHESPEMLSMMAAGGAFYSGYVTALDVGATSKQIKRAMRTKGFRVSILDSAWKLFDFYQRIGAAAENSNRIAFNYIPVKEAGATTAEAVWESKDSMNFAKHGDLAAMQFLAQSVFTFNARIQGLYRFGVRFKEAPGTTTLKALLYTLATLAIYLSFKDDDRYKDLAEDDKDLYHHFWLGDKHFRLPKAFELGTIFGTLPERMVEYFQSNEDDAGRLAIDRLKFIFSQVFQLWDPVTVVPAPNLVQPAMEATFNFDSFTRGPIIPEYMQGLAKAAPELTYDERTSPMIREMAKHAPGFLPPGLRTPLMLQHLVEGYTGTVGSTVMLLADDLIRRPLGYPAKPALAWSQLPVIGRFYRADDPPRRTKYEDVIYSIREIGRGIDLAVTQMQERDFSPDEIDAFLARPSEYSTAYTNEQVRDAAKAMNANFKELSRIFKQIDQIWLDPDMTPTQKLDELNQLYRDKAQESRDAFGLRPGGVDNPVEPTGRLDQIIDNIRGLKPTDAADMLRAQDLKATADLLASLPIQTSAQFTDVLKKA